MELEKINKSLSVPQLPPMPVTQLSDLLPKSHSLPLSQNLNKKITDFLSKK